MSYQQQFEPLDEFNLALQANVRPTAWVNPIPQGRYHLVVIGAGTAGLVSAAAAAGLGAKVALIERGLMGGDCLNFGCVPSKALISAARQIANVRESGRFGIQVDSVQIDFPEIMQRMRRLRASISPHDSASRFQGLGVDVFFGQGTFVNQNSIAVAGQTLEFKKAVIATGARASELPIVGLKEAGYLTNETLFSLTSLPSRMIVVGAGPIGCEIAQCFARFGTAVTVVEMANRILPREDEEASAIVQGAMDREGIKFVFGAKIIRVESTGSEKTVILERGSSEQRMVAEEIFIGTGRTPNLDGLGLENAGVRSNPQRGVEVDDFLRTSSRNIFAAGDVCSNFKFTHAADFMARIAVQNSLFLGRQRVSRLIVPWCTYTSPEIAQVGWGSHEAERQGISIDTYIQPFSGVDRAILDSESAGFVKVHCRRGTDRIVGATVVANNAGDLICEIVMAMKNRIGLRKIASVIHPYPTHADGIRKLGDQYNRTRLTPFVQSLFTQWLRWTR